MPCPEVIMLKSTDVNILNDVSVHRQEMMPKFVDAHASVTDKIKSKTFGGGSSDNTTYNNILSYLGIQLSD